MSFPERATRPPADIAIISCRLITGTFSSPANIGKTNAPEKNVRANSRDCKMDVMNNATTILNPPSTIIVIRVIINDLLSSSLLYSNSLRISDEVKSVVSADDMTAESSAASKRP